MNKRYFTYITIVHHPRLGDLIYAGKHKGYEGDGYVGSCKMPYWKRWLKNHPDWFQTRVLQYFDNSIDQAHAESQLILKCLDKYGSFMKNYPMSDGSRRYWLDRFDDGRCLNSHWQDGTAMHTPEAKAKSKQSRYDSGEWTGLSHDPAHLKVVDHERYVVNSEAIIDRVKAYYWNHVEEKKAYSKDYHKAHKESRNKDARDYYEAHQEEMQAYSRDYYHTHKEEQKAYRDANSEKISKRHADWYQRTKAERAPKQKAYEQTKFTNGVEIISRVALRTRIKRGKAVKEDWQPVESE